MPLIEEYLQALLTPDPRNPLAGPVAQLVDMLHGLRTDVDAAHQLIGQLTAALNGKANAATVQGLSNRLGNVETNKADAPALDVVRASAEAAARTAAAALPLAGGTLTGPVKVLAATDPANPLTLATLPLSMTVQQPLPAIALGGLYSFTVAVANAQPGQVVALGVPAALLTNGLMYGAVVSSAGTVTVTLKAGLAIAAGSQTFYLRVLR